MGDGDSEDADGEKTVEADEKEDKKENGATVKDKKEEEEEKKNGETAAPKKKPVTGKGKPKDGFKKVEQVQKGDLDNMINSPNPTFKHPAPDAEKKQLKLPKGAGGEEAPSIVKTLSSPPTSGTHVVTTNK